MKQGIDSIYVKNWKAAIEIWESAMNKGGAGLKAKLANNIAVAYELSGDINKAKEYSEKALEYIQQNSVVEAKSFVTINNYATELRKRNKEIELIDKQLGN
jgi:tetratricopeptide (TPR) repeat protein